MHGLAKYRLFIVIGGVLLALGFTVYFVAPAVAVSSMGPGPGGSGQHNTQVLQGNNNFGNSAVIVGHNQGNNGNTGINRGFNQNNVGNGGNQLSGQRKPIGVQDNHQFLRQGNGSGSGNSATFVGAFQGNSGNSGLNFGNNQDNSNNAGNQVNNQGNIIGTQINHQGTSVTNDGNIIQHQVNYVQLIPGLGVYVGLRPKLQFAVSVGN